MRNLLLTTCFLLYSASSSFGQQWNGGNTESDVLWRTGVIAVGHNSNPGTDVPLNVMSAHSYPAIFKGTPNSYVSLRVNDVNYHTGFRGQNIGGS